MLLNDRNIQFQFHGILDVLGRALVAWTWLKHAVSAARALATSSDGPDADFYRVKLQAARFHLEWEQPEIAPSLCLLHPVNAVPLEMRDGWF